MTNLKAQGKLKTNLTWITRTNHYHKQIIIKQNKTYTKITSKGRTCQSNLGIKITTQEQKNKLKSTQDQNRTYQNEKESTYTSNITS